MTKRTRLAPDSELGEPVKRFEDAFSAFTVIKETWFPHLLTKREKQQIAKRDAGRFS